MSNYRYAVFLGDDKIFTVENAKTLPVKGDIIMHRVGIFKVKERIIDLTKNQNRIRS